MGWDFAHKPADQSPADFLAAELGSWVDYKILASRMVGSVFYAAVEDQRHCNVFAAVILTQRAAGRFNFGWKVMDDSVGPAESKCPADILDLLTPTFSDWANQWRSRCRAYAATQPRRATDNRRITMVDPSGSFAFADGVSHDD